MILILLGFWAMLDTLDVAEAIHVVRIAPLPCFANTPLIQCSKFTMVLVMEESSTLI